MNPNDPHIKFLARIGAFIIATAFAAGYFFGSLITGLLLRWSSSN